MSNEQALWRAVVAQAFQDMIAPSSNRPSRTIRIQAEAQRWLTEDSRDFRDVCEYADMEPVTVLKAAQDFLRYGRPPTSIFSELPSLT